MLKIIRSPAAETDVSEIALYIAQDNVDAAFRSIDTIDRNFGLIADTPGIGQHKDDLGPDIRSVPVGNYLIFYRLIETSIEVIRVLHGARQQHPRLFRP
jgi:toxin ParE1/3/4